MSKFQIITLGIFVICIIAGVVGFATYKGSSSNSGTVTISIWGTFPADVFNKYVADVASASGQILSVNYVQQSPSTFSSAFVSALAKGQGPDVILVSADMILPQENKLTVIPYTLIPQRTFMDSYIQEAQIYLVQNGALAIPFSVDPLMMYWNRDMFNAIGTPSYPRYWDDFTALNKNITTKDSNGNIRKSALAMGDFSNITNAREILGTLLLQVGNPVTYLDSNGQISSGLSTSFRADPSSALNYFSQFANPTSPAYSWNRGMTNDKTAFLLGNLATYFGFASEISDIRSKNSNLNFDVAPVPQLKSGGVKASYGKIYGFSLVRSSANTNAAFSLISTLTSAQYMSRLSNATYLPSVRLDVISLGSSDPYMTIFNQAVLIGKTWLDVDPSISKSIMDNMVQSLINGQSTASETINSAGNQYNAYIRNAMQ